MSIARRWRWDGGGGLSKTGLGGRFGSESSRASSRDRFHFACLDESRSRRFTTGTPCSLDIVKREIRGSELASRDARSIEFK